MPNYCDFHMVIKGKEKNVLKAISILKASYNYNNVGNPITSDDNPPFHVFRTWDVFEELEPPEDGEIRAFVCGDCAWSVYSCMFDGEHTYYKSTKEMFPNTFKGITLQQMSEKYKLDIEVYSEELGIGFQEHYLIKHGKIVISEEVKYVEVDTEYDDRNIKDILTEYGFTEEDIQDKSQNGIYYIGGFHDWHFEI